MTNWLELLTILISLLGAVLGLCTAFILWRTKTGIIDIFEED